MTAFVIIPLLCLPHFPLYPSKFHLLRYGRLVLRNFLHCIRVLFLINACTETRKQLTGCVTYILGQREGGRGLWLWKGVARDAKANVSKDSNCIVLNSPLVGFSELQSSHGTPYGEAAFSTNVTPIALVFRE